MPAQGGDRDAAGTSGPKPKKASVRQGRFLPEPQWPDRLMTHLGSHQLCSWTAALLCLFCPWLKHLYLPVTPAAAPSIVQELCTAPGWWQLPKTLLSSHCCSYSHKAEQSPTGDNAHNSCCLPMSRQQSNFHATPLLKASDLLPLCTWLEEGF